MKKGWRTFFDSVFPSKIRAEKSKIFSFFLLLKDIVMRRKSSSQPFSWKISVDDLILDGNWVVSAKIIVQTGRGTFTSRVNQSHKMFFAWKGSKVSVSVSHSANLGDMEIHAIEEFLSDHFDLKKWEEEQEGY